MECKYKVDTLVKIIDLFMIPCTEPNQKNIPGLLVLIDSSKSFDSMSLPPLNG